MSEPPLILLREGCIVWLTLNRPEVGNAIDLILARALVSAALECDTDPSIRCVVLTGAGRMFCAGGDVALFEAAGADVPALLSELAGTLHMALSRLLRMAKPLLVLVNGAAAGAGLSLCLTGDVVLASSTAQFVSAYSALGLSPDGGLSWMLPRLVGLRAAQELILTQRGLSAHEARELGLITQVVEVEAFATAGAAMAERLASASTPALGAARNLLLQSLSNSLETHLELEARTIAAVSAGPEAREGIEAFLAKRPADFLGCSSDN